MWDSFWSKYESIDPRFALYLFMNQYSIRNCASARLQSVVVSFMLCVLLHSDTYAPHVVQVVAGSHGQPANIGELFSEGSLNPYADDPYAFD